MPPDAHLDAGSARARLYAYRHLNRGLAPPAAVWQATGAVATPSMSAAECSPAALAAAAASADEALLERLRERQRQVRVVPAGLPQPVQVQLALERPLAGLIAMQRRLRAEVLSHADGTALLDDADAALRLVRPRRPRRAHCSKEGGGGLRWGSAAD